MKVDRRVDSNGGIYDTIKLTVGEKVALDRCHEVLGRRFANEGEPYDRAQKEICEWWLMGLLRFEGTEKMENMAKNAPFPKKKWQSAVGYIEIKRGRRNMKPGTPDDIRYIQQTQALDEIAAKLGVVAYRPDYHGSTEDKNTVMFYIPEDAMHNRMVDQQPTRYSRSAVASLRKEGGTVIPDECIYRDSFWIFENSDVSGQLNMNFANTGKLDLCCADWKEKLEGRIRLALIQKMQARYIANIGGYLAPREVDDTNNDMNRESIEAFKMAHGGAFLGNINFYSDTRKRVLAGEESVYKEYTGQQVFNFSCDFVVPCRDEELERMIREWNRGVPNTSVRIEKITSYIEKIGGIQFIWY